MAQTLNQTQAVARGIESLAAGGFSGQETVYFRALVDLGNGGVAGIEAARAYPAPPEDASFHPVGWSGLDPGHDALAAWGLELRNPAAYLLRGDPRLASADFGGSLGVAPQRAIVMYDVAALLADPVRSLDSLLAAKRCGVRVLLDNFDMDNPPARFMEMLPADILRVTPRQMPWHWDEARRLEATASLVGFADNLLMDVAVAGVQCHAFRRELKRLGVRYAQGVWRRDTAGVVPDPGKHLLI
jgi:hypothetical protein